MSRAELSPRPVLEALSTFRDERMDLGLFVFFPPLPLDAMGTRNPAEVSGQGDTQH